VDTGVPPGALAAVRAAEAGSPTTRASGVVAPTPAGEGRQPRAPVPQPAKHVHVPPRAAVRRARAEVATNGSLPGAGERLPFAADMLLSLDDSASSSPRDDQAARGAVPWARGLRG